MLAAKDEKRSCEEEMLCFVCNKSGHPAEDCRSKPGKRNKGSSARTEKGFALQLVTLPLIPARLCSIEESSTGSVDDVCRAFESTTGKATMSRSGKNKSTGRLAMTLSIVSSRTHFLIQE